MRCDYPQYREVSYKGMKQSVSYRCGKCRGCRVQQRDNWANRIMIESLSHSDNTFLTLTYDPLHLPEDGAVSKREAQLFIKRLRTYSGADFRYFLVGEYGEKSGRPHYHAMIFGLSALELDPWVRRAWKKGFYMLSELTPGRARYVARYTTKKLKSADTSLDGPVPEFALMSKKPAVGLRTIIKVADALRGRVCSSPSLSHGSDAQVKQTKRILRGLLRYQGRTLLLDSYLRRKLLELLNIDQDSELAKFIRREMVQNEEAREFEENPLEVVVQGAEKHLIDGRSAKRTTARRQGLV